MLLAGTADLTAHGVHSAIVAGGLCLLVVLLRPAPAAPSALAVARLRRTARNGRLVDVATRQALALDRVRPDPGLRVAAVGSVAAAWIHALVAGDHLAASVVTGAFFLLAAAAQTAWAAALLLRPSYGVLVAGCAGHLAMVGIWLASRTLGAEAVGVVDGLAVTYEVLAVTAGVLVLRRMSWSPLPVDRRRSGPALAIGGTVVLALVGL